jgi:hypothetical protein
MAPSGLLRTINSLMRQCSFRFASLFAGRFLAFAVIGLLLLAGIPAVAEADVLLSSNSVWRFFRGIQEPSAVLGAWRTNTFDDSTWEVGQAPFYFGHSPASGTQMTDMRSNYTCVFLRSTFVLSNKAAVIGLTNRLFADDGFVVWINGMEVRRFNAPGAPGAAMYSTNRANTTNFVMVLFQDNADTNILRTGTNVVAVQALNVHIDDFDFFVNPEVTARLVDVTPPFVQSIQPPPGILASLDEITVTFNEPVTGVSTEDFLINGEPAIGVTGSNAVYTFTFPRPTGTNVTITWDANQVIIDAANLRFEEAGAGWTYTIYDNAGPNVVRQTPVAGSVVGGLGEVEILFNEPVNGVDAGDLLINGVPAQSAFGSGAGPYLFHFPQPATGVVQLAWSPNHSIRDSAPLHNAFAGGSWNVTLNPALFTGDVVINEFAAANILSQGGLDYSEFNVPEDWIELHNRGSNPVRLLGWSLTDDGDNPGKWSFPDVTIGAGQYLVVYASGLDRTVTGGGNRLHTNFKLNPFGSYLGLFNAQLPRMAVTEFAPEYPEQRNDYSYGRVGTDQWFYFATPTPGAANGASSIAATAPKPHLNVNRGYFNEPFTLIATCELPGATMRYTLDGSEPTVTTGQVYAGPLLITNTTIFRVAAFAPNALPSRVTTQTYLFLSSIFTQSNNPGPTFPNTFGTQGAFVSPADYEMDPEILTNALYKNLVTNALLSLPAISIVIKPADMWDPATGIYTHTLSRGPQWEKPCSMEFFTPDGSEDDFQVDAGLQAQGNASREPLKQPKHPLKVQFKGDYGPANLKYKLFHDSPRTEFDSINLRVDFNFSWLHWSGSQRARGQRTRDAWMKDSMRAMGGLSGHNRYVHLYINGLYWGVCDPSERPDAAFAAAYLGGEKEDFDAINEAHTAVDGNTAALNQMLALTNATTMLQYERFKDYLDVTQFIDYIALHFFVGHEDWGYRKNFYTIRRRAAGEGFKYIPWDGENILGTDVNRNDTTRVSTSDTTGTPSELHPKLSVNSQYRIDFADRIHRHFFNNGALMPSNNIARWMERARQVDLPIILESARWGDYRRDVHVYSEAPYELYTRDNQWLAEQNRLVGTYFPQRSAIVLAQLRARGLYPNNTAPVFNQHGGRVAPGFSLTMSATNTIYYTTNGSDPRLYGTGAVSPLAQVYAGPIGIESSMVIKARMLAGTNWSALNEAEFTVGSLTLPVRITEVMYNPPDGEVYEYLELQNIGTTPLDLGNHSFVNITFTFPFGFTLAPGQRIILANNGNTNAFHQRYPGVAVMGWYGASLANGGEMLAILDPAGRTVFSMTFDDENGWPTSADGGGYSLELIEVNGDSDSPSNWRASTAQNGTPGQANSIAPPPVVLLNELAAENLTSVENSGTYPDWVELFNPAGTPVNLAGWSLSDDGNTRKFVFPNGITLPAAGYLVVWFDSVTNTTPGLHAGFSLGRNGDSVFLYDPGTNRVDAISFGPQVADYTVGRRSGSWGLTIPTPNAPNIAATTASVSSLSINEWLARPVAGADDWIELFNASSNEPAPLQNVYVGTSNALVQIRSLSFVAPRGFVQLIADENPGADHLGLKIPAEGGAIVLYSDAGLELQRVLYGAQAEGVSGGRLPDGSGTIVAFPGSASPAASNYALSYTGPTLNEILARNSRAVVAPFGRPSDYVEIYNPTAAAFDLGGMGLSDEPDEVKFIFPAGTVLPAKGHSVVWCDSDGPASSGSTLNSGFSLSSRSGGVYLFNSDGQVVDAVEYGFQVTDLPIGRSASDWRLLSASTPGTTNAVPAILGSTSNLRLNEWMAEQPEGFGWLEIYNLDVEPVEMTGLYLSDDPSLAGLSNTPIAALSFIGGRDWVEWTCDGIRSNGRDHTGFDLNPAGETIRLYGADFGVIDSISFGAQAAGTSEGRLPDGGSNITAFPTTSTPEASNFLPLEQIVISEVLAHTDSPFEDAIEVQNTGSNAVAIGNWWISNSQRDLKKFRVPAGTILAPGAFRVFYENQFNLDGTGQGTNFTLNSARGDDVFLSEADAVGNLTGYRAQVEFDATENAAAMGRFLTSLGTDFVPMASRTFGADNPASVVDFRTGAGLSNSYPRVGPIVINEIMYHPVSGLGSNATEKTTEEFIELHNVTDAPVPLFDPARPLNTWRLSGGVSFDFATPITVPARGYLLLVAFDPQANPSAAANFRARYGSNGVLAGPIVGRLNNNGEELALHRPDVPQQQPDPDAGLVPMILVDRVIYDDAPPWPVAADGGNGSLQRKGTGLYGNEPLNWKAEPATAGMTNNPGTIVAPTITVHPEGRTVLAGDTVALSVAVSGTPPLSYQWQRDGLDIPGATDASFTLTNVQLSQAGSYRVTVTNAAGGLTSLGAAVIVLVPPYIIDHPLPQTAVAGSNVQLAVAAGGSAPLHYQWRFNGNALEDETNPELTLNNVQLAQAGEYAVVISNNVGIATSLVAVLNIIVPPAITADPEDVFVVEGYPAVFSVSATGTAPLSYQWRKDGTDIPGATGSTYAIETAFPEDEGLYHVEVSNVAGKVVSAGARLNLGSGLFLNHPQIRPDGVFQFTLSGQTNRLYAVEFTTNLAAWTALTNFILAAPQATISDASSNAPTRFYRVRTEP